MREEMENSCKRAFKNRSFVVDILTVFFAIGTWIGVNSTFIELPLLVNNAPEGWSLPSYLSVAIQLGNVGPLIYTLVQKYSRRTPNDPMLIYMLLTVGSLAALLTSFFYDTTATIAGKEYSLALFILTFFTAVNACTSNVLYMPYMGRFKEIYIITFYIGEGLSGLLPSLVALIQGVGGTAECVLVNVTASGQEIFESYTPPPLFGPMAFFMFVFVMMICSFLAFTLLQRLKLARQQYAPMRSYAEGNDYTYDNKEDNSSIDTNENLPPKITKNTYWLLLVLMSTISFFANGILNSIQSYSTLPYGNNAYHFSATLSVIANPVACFVAVFIPHISMCSILTLVSIAGVLTSYAFVTASMSPVPPLVGTIAGPILVVVTWTLLIGIVSYVKICIVTIMRSQGGKSLIWTGAVTQLGSLIGSLLIFVLINFTKSFESAEYDSLDC